MGGSIIKEQKRWSDRAASFVIYNSVSNVFPLKKNPSAFNTIY